MLVIGKRPGGSTLIIGERPGGSWCWVTAWRAEMCDPSGMATCKAVMDHSLEGKWGSAILTLQNYMYAGMGLMLILLKNKKKLHYVHP